jgi:hypothetical protein
LPTPEEKYYDGMNTLLAPVRWAKSLMQTVLIILLLIGAGLLYPVIQLCNGEPLTLFSFLIPALTILIIVTFFYTPYYTIFAVFVGGLPIAVISAQTDISKYRVCLLIFALFGFGILQKYIRNRIKYNRVYNERAKEPAAFERQKANEERREAERKADEERRRADANRAEYFRKDAAAGRQGNAERTQRAQREYARNSYSAGSQSSREFDCEKCDKSYRLLDLPYGASDEDVNSKKRAFNELFHDDKVAGKSDSARRIALEKLQVINSACDHILRFCEVRKKERTENGVNSSESPRQPRKSAGATTVNRDVHQHPSASAPDDSGMKMQESPHNVPTNEELIAALDATRMKVEESTRKTEEFIEEMKRRRQRSLERL